MTTVAMLLGAAVVATLLFGVFVRWERSGKEHCPVAFILALLVAELVLYENQDLMPRGLFHPGTGSLDFRLPEILITLALLARVVVRGWGKTIGIPALLWLAFGAWLVVATVEGVIRHNSMVKLPYEAKAIVYVVGGYALAAGVPVRQYLDARVFQRLARWAGLGALLLELMTLAHKIESVPLPLLNLPNFGEMGGDSAAVFLSLGLVALLLELAQDRPDRLTMLACLPLLISPFFPDQRASLVMLAASVGVVLVVALGPTARARLRVGAGHVVLCLLAAVGVVLGVALVPALTAQKPVHVPVVSSVVGGLGAESKAESAQARLNKWSVVWQDVQADIILGHGLGFEYSYYQPGPNQFIVTDLAENIFLDLWLRAGLIGLALFLVALVVALVNGLQTWRYHLNPAVAVLALALVAVVIGIVAKGQFESVFEKYREATFLGLALGALRSAVTSSGGLRVSYRALRAGGRA